MRQINITGTKMQLADVLAKLTEDGEVTLSTDDEPIRPDRNIEIVLREQDDDEDAPEEPYYHEEQL